MSWIDKEEDAESDLGDFGVRKYDDGMGRFMSIDPLWEKYRSLSPYNYCGNNPLMFVDPTGTEWFDLDGDGAWTWDDRAEISMPVTTEDGQYLLDDQGNVQIEVIKGKEQLLTFDGQSLTWYRKNGDIMSWSAVSGVLKDGMTDPSTQSVADYGPTPEGWYTISPQDTESKDRYRGEQNLWSDWRNTQRWEDENYRNAWGDYRTILVPYSTTDTFGRHSMYLHGGSTPGSIGCIDLTSGNNRFHRLFLKEGVTLQLQVQYRQPFP